MRHPVRQVRRCGVYSQRWSAGVTPPPLIARTNGQRLLLPPGKRSRIVSLFCMSHVIAAHAVIKSPLNAFQNASCSQRISHIRIRIAIGSQFLARFSTFEDSSFCNQRTRQILEYFMGAL
jgi:hypothetical protein